MMNSLLDITDKLSEGLVELYKVINEHATKLGIPYLVVGATARDIVLVHGYGASVERGTRDVDFGIQVKTWEQFEQLKACLLESGLEQHKDKVHQLTMIDSTHLPWEIDIVPFGEISQNTQDNGACTITWPPEGVFVMSVMGFAEAYTDALTVTISKTPKLQIKVASPAGMLVLKLISWFERGSDIRKKDALDIYYLIKHYAKIPEVSNALYDQGFMEAQNYIELDASAMKLAADAKLITSSDTLTFISERLFDDEQKLDNLILDVSRSTHIEYKEVQRLLNIVKQRFSDQ